jgi:hypothetical protein
MLKAQIHSLTSVNRHYCRLFFAPCLLLIFQSGAAATIHYVDLNSTNAGRPYTNWATAATNIQDAVDAAVAGDEVVVTNGIYAGGDNASSRVSIASSITLRTVVPCLSIFAPFLLRFRPG